MKAVFRFRAKSSYRMVTRPRERIALISPEGLLVGVTFTPSFREEEKK